MASGATPIESGLGEILRQTVVNLGAASPTSLGKNELLNAINTAILGFTPPSLESRVLAPTNAVAQTFSRQLITSAAETSASGVLTLSAISIPADTGTTAAITPANQWAALFNASRVMLAVSADATTTAMPASTVTTYPVATIAQGAATSFTTTYTGLYYVGICVVAGTQPTWQGYTGTATDTTIPPILAGSSTGSLTGPPTFPTTAGTITPTAAELYAYLT